MFRVNAASIETGSFVRILATESTTSSFFKGDGSAVTGIISSSHSNQADTTISSSHAVQSNAAITASFVNSSSHANQSDTSISASFASTGSSVDRLNQVVIITGSLFISGTVDATGYSVTASAFAGSGVNITGIVSSSHANFADTAITASYIASASHANNTDIAVSASFASTSSYLNPLIQSLRITGSLNVSGAINNTGYSISSSFFTGDGSAITGIVSASHANQSDTAITASFVASASHANVADIAISASYAPGAGISTGKAIAMALIFG